MRNITLDSQARDIFIDNGLIVRIEPAGSSLSWPLSGDIEFMDCSDKVALPGFVNMHTHAAMSLLRGIGEDMLFPQWLAKIWKVEENIDSEFVYWGTKVACLEMIRTGTTTFNDQYWHFPEAHRAAVEMGLRPALGYDILDLGDRNEAERQKEQCERLYSQALGWNDNSIYEVAFHAIYSVSEEMICWISDFATKHNLNLHIHLSETRKEVEDCKAAHGGLTPVEYLHELGVLNNRLLAAHTLWLTPHDIELLANAGAHCIHNINSNTKLSSGYRFLYNEMRDAGINMCIGTDGCASSNNLDIQEAMKTSSLLQKGWRRESTSLPLNEVMVMATANGARAMKVNGGKIEAGALADLLLVDTHSAAFTPNINFLSNLIYASNSSCIDTVICQGDIVMEHRKVKDEDLILEQAAEHSARLVSKAQGNK